MCKLDRELIEKLAPELRKCLMSSGQVAAEMGWEPTRVGKNRKRGILPEPILEDMAGRDMWWREDIEELKKDREKQLELKLKKLKGEL